MPIFINFEPKQEAEKIFDIEDQRKQDPSSLQTIVGQKRLFNDTEIKT